MQQCGVEEWRKGWQVLRCLPTDAHECDDVFLRVLARRDENTVSQAKFTGTTTLLQQKTTSKKHVATFDRDKKKLLQHKKTSNNANNNNAIKG